jgi:hypothetical protein
VLWNASLGNLDQDQLFLGKSTDGGASFQSPVAITPVFNGFFTQFQFEGGSSCFRKLASVRRTWRRASAYRAPGAMDVQPLNTEEGNQDGA